MSHYTSIKTKYNNPKTFKKVLNNLEHPYTEHESKKNFNNIEVFLLPSKSYKHDIYNNTSHNSLTFQWNGSSYNMITDSQSWTQKELINLFLKKLELNYGYSETINQAFELGFTRSKIITNEKINRFVFQRCIEMKN